MNKRVFHDSYKHNLEDSVIEILKDLSQFLNRRCGIHVLVVQDTSPEHFITLLVTPTNGIVFIRTFVMPLRNRVHGRNTVRINIRKQSYCLASHLYITIPRLANCKRVFDGETNAICAHKGIHSSRVRCSWLSIYSDVRRRTQRSVTSRHSKQ